ncbi:MAG: aminomethyl-transferring glycine dehydrogenase subunit GcvPB [Candidatus Bathyarchaeia archaeon]
MKDNSIRLRRYHAPVWNEPIIMEMGHKGERGILVPQVEEEIKRVVKDAEFYIPAKIRRKEPPNLPELSQAQVLRHYLRLSQETLGMELTPDISEGTCTMKYSPKVNEEFVGEIADIHPLQDEDTIQGLLEILYKFAHVFLTEISGMDEFTFQPGGGAEGVYTNACIMRKYHEMNGELKQRDEVITTLFSHPCDAATPATAGFKVITLYPNEETGYPDVEALKAAVSKHTAGLMITNPEDTGIYNKDIDEWTKIVHEVGGLCHYDQANANALLGIARAKEAGFDMCQFNIHKTFSSPHGCMGPACGAVGVKEELAKFLPVPVVTFDGNKYHLDYDRPYSIGKIRDFLGNVECIIRAYAWSMSLGAEGLREVAEVSTININYLDKKLSKIRGITKPFKAERRVDQIRYSLGKMKKDTDVGTDDFARRMVDYGIQSWHKSHHPWVIPEPFTPEPCETYSKEDIDYWALVIEQISKEAYEDPELVKTAPHRSSAAKIYYEQLNDPQKWAMTWRAYVKKRGTKKS